MRIVISQSKLLQRAGS